MSNYWLNESDFEEDLWALSTCKPQSLKSVEISNHLKEARTKPHIYDYGNNLETDTNFNGFGRGISLRMEIPKPGGKPSFLNDIEKTSAEIREVCGAGFSNELIEQQMKTHNNAKEERTSIKLNKIPDLSFQPCGRSSMATTPKYTKSGKPGKRSKQNAIKSNNCDRLEFSDGENSSSMSSLKYTEETKSLDINSEHQFPKLS